MDARAKTYFGSRDGSPARFDGDDDDNESNGDENGLIKPQCPALVLVGL